ncbi:MAG: hypothetical protein LBH57_06730 [Treponema sp.]|jgi:hypothetical protein|nr:hypothetical protein [Treponema sp.]
MDKDEVLALLEGKFAAVKHSAGKETINRLAAVLTVPASFEELEWELPPMARYVGPGVWMDAIKAGGN